MSIYDPSDGKEYENSFDFHVGRHIGWDDPETSGPITPITEPEVPWKEPRLFSADTFLTEEEGSGMDSSTLGHLKNTEEGMKFRLQNTDEAKRYSKPIAEREVQKITFGGAGGAVQGGFDTFQNVIEAHKLSREGVSPADVFSRTGVLFGHDGKIRFEMNDQNARIKTENLNAMKHVITGEPIRTHDTKEPIYHQPIPFLSDKKMTVGDLLDHPELYKHYPEIEKMKIVSNGLSLNSAGFYSPDQKVIGVGHGSEAQMKETLLHEIQHAIQHKEGFARGSSVQEYLKNPVEYKQMSTAEMMATKRLEELWNEKRHTHPVGKEGTFSRFDYTMMQHVQGNQLMKDDQIVFDHIKKTDPAYFKAAQETVKARLALRETYRSAFEEYKKTLGEAEARIVEERLGKGELERRWLYPYAEEEFKKTYPDNKVPEKYIKFEEDHAPARVMAPSVNNPIPKPGGGMRAPGLSIDELY